MPQILKSNETDTYKMTLELPLSALIVKVITEKAQNIRSSAGNDKIVGSEVNKENFY